MLKISKVTPTDKAGDATNPASYQPISTLSVLSQILEKLIFKQLSNNIEKLDILFQYQFGFRKGVQALIELTDTLRKQPIYP